MDIDKKILSGINAMIIKAAENKEELWERPKPIRPPRRVYIRGRKVISRVPIKQEG